MHVIVYDFVLSNVFLFAATWFHFARFFECLGMLGFLIIISYISTIQCPIRFLRCHRFLEIVSLLTGM